jgi:hypothetical protein
MWLLTSSMRLSFVTQWRRAVSNIGAGADNAGSHAEHQLLQSVGSANWTTSDIGLTVAKG